MNNSIKIIKLIMFSSLLMVTSLSAEVRFDIRFTDPAGTGLNDPKNEWMKSAVTEGANTLGKSIKQNAFVAIDIISYKGYAVSPAYLRSIESPKSKFITKAMDKILKGDNSKFSGLFEGKIQLCPDMFSEYNTLKRVVIHELTHALGFISIIGNPNDSKSNYGKFYSPFDQLIEDSEGNSLIIDNRNDSKFNPNFNPSLDLFACGSNIKKHNNGECVKLYNPETFSSGSSFSHLDTDTYLKNLLNHKGGSYDIWNKYEIGIMEDLGYNIDWENYCKIVENELFKSYALTVDMNALKNQNCYFVLKKLKNNDFPQECLTDETFHRSFSSQFANGYQLQFFLNDQLIHECNSIEDFKSFENIPLLNENYRIELKPTSDSLHLAFIDIKAGKNDDHSIPVKTETIENNPTIVDQKETTKPVVVDKKKTKKPRNGKKTRKSRNEKRSRKSQSRN